MSRERECLGDVGLREGVDHEGGDDEMAMLLFAYGDELSLHCWPGVREGHGPDCVAVMADAGVDYGRDEMPF